MADDQPHQIYRLLVNVAGPGFADRIKIEAETVEELEPLEVEVGGLVYERYGSLEDYVEIRRDYVIARSLNTISINKNTVSDDDDRPEFLHDIKPQRPTARFPPARGEEDE
jgi:hypothetical protein